MVYSQRRTCFSLKGINKGDCWVWAIVAKRLLKDLVKIHTVEVMGGNRPTGHVFIEILGTYYDAETLVGVTNWRKLSFFQTNCYTESKFHENVEEESLYAWGEELEHAKNLFKDSEGLSLGFSDAQVSLYYDYMFNR